MISFIKIFLEVSDTDRWKQELAALAAASGLGVEKDEHKHSNKLATETIDQQHTSRSGAHYSRRTGRFNEGTGKSRGRTSSRHATAYPDMLFNVSENEREMWVRERSLIIEIPTYLSSLDFSILLV